MRCLPLVLSLALVGCSAIRVDSPLREAEAPAVTLPLEQVWQVTAESGFGATPLLVREGVVLAGTRGGDLRAYDLVTGRGLGHADLDAPLEGAFAADERAVYVPLSMRRRGVVAYDLLRGRKRWRARVGAHEAGVLLAGEYVIAAGRDATLRALHRDTGAERWARSLDSLAGVKAGLIQLGDHHALAAMDDGVLHAFDVRDGRPVWAATVGAPVYETPALGEGLVVVPTTRGRLVALSPDRGEARWTLDAQAPTLRFATPIVHQGRVIVGGSDGVLRALAADSGAELWRFRADGNFSSAPVAIDGVVYAGSLRDTLYAIDVASGQRLWETKLRGRLKSAPVAAGRLLLVATEPSHITAFGPQTELSP